MSKKSHLELNCSGCESDRSSDFGQASEDNSTKPICSATSSPQASPKLTHRNRGSKGSTPSTPSIATAISEEGPLGKNLDVSFADISCSGSNLLDHEDAISRSSESNKSFDVSLRTPDSTSCRDLCRDKKSSSSSDKKRKSSSWYNVLNPTYKSKTEDFKRLFKDLPDTERLIVDYSCAIQKDILVHGRLYISQNFICFYANIFRWETFLTIRCKDITSMTKEKTALVIPNAIQVSTVTSEKHFFTSFGARDKAYLMLFRVWQNALLEQPMLPLELWQWIHYSYGDELGLTSDDDDYVSPPIAEEDLLKSGNGDLCLTDGIRKSGNALDLFVSGRLHDSPSETFDATPFLAAGLLNSSSPNLTSSHNLMDSIGNGNYIEEAVEGDDDDDEEDNTDDDDVEFVVAPSKTQSGFINGLDALLVNGSMNGNLSEHGDGDGMAADDSSKYITPSPKMILESPLPKNLSDSSETDNDLSEAKCPCQLHEGKEILNQVFPIPVDRLFEMLFTDSAFFNDFHISRKTTDMSHSPWRPHPEGQIRQVSYALFLNIPMGAKMAQTTETQIMRKCSKPGKMYILEVDAINSGIPYADNFFTHHQHCITRVSADKSRLRVCSIIKYKKSVWGFVKSIIEKNAMSGIDDFFKGLEEALVKESTKTMKPGKTRPNRKTRPKKLDNFLGNSILPLDSPSVQATRTQSTSISRDASRPIATSDILVPLILAVLILLLILNALLYYKLWALEASNSSRVFPSHFIDPELLRKPKSNEDWMHLIQQQEILHQAEINKWREVIDTVVSVLRETENSLVNLKQNIQPYGFSTTSMPRAEAS